MECARDGIFRFLFRPERINRLLNGRGLFNRTATLSSGWPTVGSGSEPWRAAMSWKIARKTTVCTGNVNVVYALFIEPISIDCHHTREFNSSPAFVRLCLTTQL